MDVFGQMRKIDKKGAMLNRVNYPVPNPKDQVTDLNIAKYHGPQGMLRASHAVSQDHSRTSPDDQVLFYKHDYRKKIEKRSIVPLEITLWPIRMAFDEGETICLRISGHDMAFLGLPMPRALFEDLGDTSVHELHTGGQHDSYLISPFI